MFFVVEEFLENTKYAKSEDALADEMQLVIHQLGFESFCAFSADIFDGPSDRSVCIDRFPEDWIIYHAEQEYWRRDPLLKAARESARPFMWNDPQVSCRFSEDEQAYMSEAADAGVGGGLLVPIRIMCAPLGHFSVCSGGREVDPASMAKVHNLGVCFYNLAHRMAVRRAGKSERSVQPLNFHERESLLWLSVGMPDWDISSLLGVSENSVRLHIYRAMRKFGVLTRTQAVVQAIVMGEISP